MELVPQGRNAQQRVITPARQDLSHALTTGIRLILTYLIPCHLLTTHTLPTQKLLGPHPRLQKLFWPLCQAIKKGELHSFDLALQEAEDEFVKRRIYLTLERGRDIALRNLLRKVFIAGGFEAPKEKGATPLRRTRIPVDEFVAAISLGSQQMLDPDEVECLLANMIYKVSLILSLFARPVLSCAESFHRSVGGVRRALRCESWRLACGSQLRPHGCIQQSSLPGCCLLVPV